MSKSISRVLYLTVIYLGNASLHRSSHPCGTDGQPICPASRCCSRWGLQSVLRYRRTGELLPHLSTLTNYNWRFISVALSLIKSPSPGVTRHPCPLEPGLSSYAAFQHYTRDRLIYSLLLCIIKLIPHT